jgi:recombination protein RecA
MFGSPETTTGGRALKFYTSVRIDLRRIESLKRGEEIYGTRVRAKVVKNKVAPPFKEAEFEILFDEGISRISDVIDLGVKSDVIHKSGAWFSLDEEKIGQGRESVRKFLQDNPKVIDAIEKKIMAKLRPVAE